MNRTEPTDEAKTTKIVISKTIHFFTIFFLVLRQWLRSWITNRNRTPIIAKRSPSQSKSIPIGLDVDGITFAISPPTPGKVPIADSKQHPAEYNIRPASGHIWGAPWPQFWPKFRPEKFLTRKFSDPKNFLTQKFFRPKKFLIRKIFWPEKFF